MASGTSGVGSGINWAVNDTYITLTRADNSSTEYKVELWTVVGSGGASADAYTLGSNDRAQLIGYIDVGATFEGTGAATALAQVDFL